ncbi:cadherin-like domain-containing protein [Chryseolinea sp. T2]|uniref:Ig-like domain-containing protein n=1 Tax=Chryseolinea sp. T2 TaxID=3129255 RepID=UPI003077B451
MHFRNLLLLCVLTVAAHATYAQLNVRPLILGQDPISTNENVPITIPFTALRVVDLDDNYPNGFTMSIDAGTNYTVNGQEITPARNFHGRLNVPVRVNDGEDDSNTLTLIVTVNDIPNVKPVINSVQSLSTTRGTPITLTLADFSVTDPDNLYPDDFTLRIFSGANYSRSGTTVTPNAGFTGTLSVRVRVDDGEDESVDFNADVVVNAPLNVAPVITGQSTLTTPQATAITITTGDLTVTDPDNTYPQDFTISLQPGTNYTVNNLTVTPAPAFTGELTVPVSVNDGTTQSAVFNLKIDVTPVNQKPQITGQVALSTVADSPITIEFGNLTVTDDDPYPTGFTMALRAGAHYTFSGRTVTPEAGYVGPISVPVSINDGEVDSDIFNVVIDVTPKPNTKPVITGQTPLSTFIATSITLKLADFQVTDPDNVYPNDFTLKVYPGVGYSFSGTTITPNLLFLGTLTVPVTVNDGQTESDRFDAKILVTLLPNVAPVITNQTPLSVTSSSNLTIQLANLFVTDPDDTYPNGFTLTVYNGQHYSVNGTTITADAGFTGTLKVPVTVNDGHSESARYNLDVTVNAPVNVAPTITAQSTLEINEDQTQNVTLGMLTVVDPDDPNYPSGFTLKLRPPATNSNYTLDGNRVVPAKDFNGTLKVPLVVNDGKDDSPVFELIITVRPVNDAPTLEGQKVLTTYVTTPITISISDLVIKDPDNDPGDITFRVNNGPNYTFSGLTVTPNTNFKGELKVNITLSDGRANTNAQVSVRVSDTPNVAPIIEGQSPNPFIVTQNTPLAIEITKLIVTDPDNTFPTDFTLTVLSGANYTVSGTTITPASNFLGSLQVPVTVSDGTANSAPFTVSVSVVAPSARPQITGQQSLVMNEDETLTIALADLLVTDTDDVYPNGFKLDILTGSGYTFNGTSVTPAKNLNGFLIVSVKVTDAGGKSSDPYGLAILIKPVDDAPVITQFETTPLSYEPGAESIFITSVFDVEDVDNDYLSFAEIGIQKKVYTKGYDELLFSSTAAIRGVFDADSGKLSLIGYATLAEYKEAIRSIKYHYRLNEDETGTPQALPGDKVIYVSVHDGQLPSETRTRSILMETTIDLRIPTAFSPNDDTVNETWQVLALSNPQQCENALVRVYDKRGVLLFESRGIEKKWDGTYNGVLLPTDTYYYTVDLNLSYAKRTYKGAVSLMR